MDDEYYMRLALQEACRAKEINEVPIGAVVVYQPFNPATRQPLDQPEIIAKAYNVRETKQDPAGHAEFVALQKAAKRLGVWRLSGCSVYVTLEPCLMCAGLMYQARIDRCVYAAADPKAGALGSLYTIHNDMRLNHSFDVVAGVLAEESSQLLQDFFRSLRKNKTSGQTSK